MFFEESDVIEDRTEEADYPASELDDYDSSSTSGDSDDDNDDDQASDDELGFTWDGSELGSSSGDSSSDEDESVDSGSSYEDCGKKRRRNAQPPEKPATPHRYKIPFTKQSSTFLPTTLTTTPLSYFLHFVDETFLRTVCEHTNRHAEAEYAARRKFAGVAGAGGQEETWRHVNIAEFKVFIAILLHASLDLSTIYDDDHILKPRYCRYLNRCMPLARFTQILLHLHFSSRHLDLKDLAMAVDLVDYFNDKMSASYYPGRELWINNSVVVWRGDLMCRERVQRTFEGKHGIAIDALTEPATGGGVTLRVRLTPSLLELQHANGALSRLVVEDLMQGYLDCGHALYLDPFFCGVSVARRLLERRTSCTGLLYKTPRGCRRQLSEGGHAAVRRRGGVLLGVWRSGGTCSYLTTEYDAGVADGAGGESTGKVRAPAAISAFLRATRREQREDMLRESPGGRLRLQWHKHVFLLLLHMLTRNAHAFYLRHSVATDAAGGGGGDGSDGDGRATATRRPLSFFEFRVEVSLAMLPLVDYADSDDEAADVLGDGDYSGSESSRNP